MDTDELKFLLKLLGFPNYRASLSAFSSTRGRDKILQNLGDRELVDYSREVAAVKILPAGQALLKLGSGELPITEKELKVLEKVSQASGKITPSNIKISSLKAADKEAILKTLTERGLIEPEIKKARNKVEVWLTQRGVEYLRDDYDPQGKANITLDLLNNYLRFLRKTLRVQPQTISTPLPSVNITDGKISDEEILEIIEKLDRELGTDNYLPIFHLRQKLQPPLLRDELDQALYRLQKDDQIDFSSLLDPTPYTTEQIDAGISQNVGGSLFFISVN
ncbi:transcription factor RcaD [Nostoc sp. CENA67]|uniref:Transcription factor RcaD n=1 Tax=Amazonocrinis nigriterrae CENA67 TaxID=2794033 RepID=A0A8J7L970_9NOST|nr:transcription factor RcaD [Amazonocrinis nigriterrae]MBH8564098.1 transcription factor RcaD [Amazonocrinis nigriterrae CENA67]